MNTSKQRERRISVGYLGRTRKSALRFLRTFALFAAITSAAVGANLVPHSSFEGAVSGWSMDAVGVTNQTLIVDGGLHGSKAMRLPKDGRLQTTGPIALNAGHYMLSAFMRTVAAGGSQGPYYMAVVASPALADSAFPHSIGNIGEAWVRPLMAITIVTNGLYYVKFANLQPDVLIDAVQLEPGDVETAYAPMEAPVMGKSLVCSWDASPELMVQGYRVLVGPKSRTYPWALDVLGRLNTSAPIALTNLPPGVSYFAVIAVANGQVSDFSEEVTWTNGFPAPKNFRVTP